MEEALVDDEHHGVERHSPQQAQGQTFGAQRPQPLLSQQMPQQLHRRARALLRAPQDALQLLVPTGDERRQRLRQRGAHGARGAAAGQHGERLRYAPALQRALHILVDNVVAAEVAHISGERRPSCHPQRLQAAAPNHLLSRQDGLAVKVHRQSACEPLGPICLGRRGHPRRRRELQADREQLQWGHRDRRHHSRGRPGPKRARAAAKAEVLAQPLASVAIRRECGRAGQRAGRHGKRDSSIETPQPIATHQQLSSVPEWCQMSSSALTDVKEQAFQRGPQ
mmetsp:Transcript_22053/g.75611  ORF Transcript_22053/g.75611 Transcript_22053/m.75611 type:complete len:281 (-) Transcript_22053:353-1195(-)